MKLKYTGPKEIISANGISFKRGKDDKYVYIYPAMQLYNALNHDYEKDIIYTHNIEGKRLNDEEVLSKILSLNPNLKEEFKKGQIEIENFLDEELEDVGNHKEYTVDEQKIYKNNLNIMREYRTQREINKVAYKILVKAIVDDIFEHKIKEVNAPFNERFWHILQTIQGELSNHNKRSIGSTLDIIHKDIITISLKINSIGK